MQKVLRRTALAKAQVARRYAREAQIRIKRKQIEQRQYEASLRAHRGYMETIRAELEDDIKRGPLAAIRGVNAKDRIARDLPDAESLRLPEVVEKRAFFNIVAGDRVVLLAGKDRNKVGVVRDVDHKTDSVKVRGLNVYPIRTPAYFEGLEGGENPGIDQEISIPYVDVRLVHPVPDPKTGALRDAIVKKVRVENVRKDAWGKKTWQRYIAFTNTVIPWPPKTEPEYADEACDTRRMDVEERTYLPTLLKPPFPGPVIDELRGKYSKFRDRHDREYIEQKMKEDEDLKARMKAKVITPLMEINRKIRQEKIERGKRQKLTPEILEQIGRAMAQSGSPFLKARTKRSRILDEISKQEGPKSLGMRMPPPLPSSATEAPPPPVMETPPS
ncbi:hypothetical protein DRE_04872 [Drechslerella stenobrocha 248]|uniref:KOW domain-containing protein n=1 Tax=Drechslerella stenobrocha 248 TaxID=1043628 RepID=W7I9Y5_9PEZI|nr:hypothetical protein DRE_04872 [Drechslerella stenobrocha 248]